MIRYSIFLVISFFSVSTLACSVPKSGPEYDALINVIGPNLESNYTVSVPKNIKGYKYPASITLAYTKIREDGYRLMESSREIHTKEIEGKLVGQFAVNNIVGQKAYIRVYWPPDAGGMCGVHVTSNLEGQ